jgi:hypothetical protein
MDFPESKYHASGAIPSEFYANIHEEEDASDAPTVVVPRPRPEPPPIEERWFIDIPF